MENKQFYDCTVYKELLAECSITYKTPSCYFIKKMYDNCIQLNSLAEKERKNELKKSLHKLENTNKLKDIKKIENNNLNKDDVILFAINNIK